MQARHLREDVRAGLNVVAPEAGERRTPSEPVNAEKVEARTSLKSQHELMGRYEPEWLSPVSELQKALYWHEPERPARRIDVDEYGALLPRPKE